MSDIRDNDLILFHYRDSLPPERVREIEHALATSPPLAARYRALRRVLAGADCDDAPLPDARFEHRLWRNLQPRLQAAGTASIASAVPSRPAVRSRLQRHARRWGAGLAAAAVLVIAMKLPMAPDPAPRPAAVTRPVATHVPGGDRALAAYVAAHLRSTEGALLSAINDDGNVLAPAGDAFVRALADDNRMYALAAARRGDEALAGFLHSLDPVLIELANRPRTSDVQPAQLQPHRDLSDFVQSRDLLFQLRAVEARMQSRSTTT